MLILITLSQCFITMLGSLGPSHKAGHGFLYWYLRYWSYFLVITSFVSDVMEYIHVNILSLASGPIPRPLPQYTSLQIYFLLQKSAIFDYSSQEISGPKYLALHQKKYMYYILNIHQRNYQIQNIASTLHHSHPFRLHYSLSASFLALLPHPNIVCPPALLRQLVQSYYHWKPQL